MTLIEQIGLRAGPEWIIDDPRNGTFSVLAHAYSDPDIFRLEQERIFDRCWLYALHDSELAAPGDYLTREIMGRDVLFTRAKDGQIRAFHNVCRHKAASVCRSGRGNASRFTCIYHGWTYGNDGRLIGMPLKEAYSEKLLGSDMGLFPVRLESYRGLLFVCFDKSTGSLLEFLAGAVEPLDLILDQHEEGGWEVAPGAYDYNMAANWKLIMENSLDAGHIGTVHAGYFDVYLPDVQNTRMSRDKIFDRGSPMPKLKDYGNGHSANEVRQFTANPDREKRAAWEERYGEAHATRLIDYSRQMLLFPNTYIAETFPMIRTYHPRSSGMTRALNWSFVPKSDTPEARARRIQAFTSFQGPTGFGTPDDVEVLEGCQRNCVALPADAYLDVSRGMGRVNTEVDDELFSQSLLREWHRSLFGDGGRDDGRQGASHRNAA